MSQTIDRVASALFPETGTRVANVKFFLGANRRITGAQLAAQLESADAQIREGTATRVIDVDNYRRA